MKRPLARDVALALGWIAAYVAAGAFAVKAVAEPDDVALYWPASGIALAGAMRYGARWVVLVPLAQLLVQAFAPVPAAFLPFSLLSNAVGAWLGATWAGRQGRPTVMHQVTRLPVAGLLMAVTGATVGTFGMWLAHMVPADRLADAWLRWMFGDLLGVVSVAPAVLLLLDARERPQAIDPGPGSEAERQVWNIALVASFLLMAWGATEAPKYVLGLTSLPLAIMLWSALRFSALRTATSVLLTVGLVGMLAGYGLAGFRPPARTLEAVILLVYLSLLATMPGVLAMAMRAQRASARSLERRATTDPLTGLPNRAGFEAKAATLLADPASSSMALVYLDLDNLKLINDTATHAAGDALIAEVATALRGQVTARDLLGHYGADEFIVLLNGCSITAARERAQALLRAVEHCQCEFGDQRLSTTASIGLVPFQPNEMSLAEVLSQADAACFTAKEQGGNRVALGGSLAGALTDATSEMRWTLRIRQALKADDSFQLYAQSIVPLAAATAGYRFELLLRLRDPNGGALHTPDKFLPAATRFGLSARIDRKVVDTALACLEAHPEAASQVAICAINLSGHALADESFIGYLVQRVRRSPVAPQRLCFEITETSAVRDMARAQRVVGELRGLGCQFALDDFGTGLCSFNYLRALDVDCFKIDGSFVRDMDQSPLALEVVRSITRIAHVLHKSTIAEHTETPAQRDALAGLGVDFAQGYLFDRPRPLAAFLAEAAAATSDSGG
ncbi:putative bifunctional diguanylate cyclase/phosphodiesterase [Lysobacter yangpyeongensis]|uniref:Bifunctional diguanylate cyclase/phosphodiesterase n=1 Tax=Lysobacter yangpyeongensis TaxID=346182 RepID=A0ABW0SN34_9GAMM